MEGAKDIGAGELPPPPPVPAGAVPSKAPGYGGGNGSAHGGGSGSASHTGPNGGPNGGGNGAGPNGGHNGGVGPSRGNGSAALAALALLPKLPIPPKATRPEFGRDGRPTKLCVNYFRAKLTKADDVYHYNVRMRLFCQFSAVLLVMTRALGLSIALCLARFRFLALD